jgi:hypothetical protein
LILISFSPPSFSIAVTLLSMEAESESEYWMPELLGDDDDWVSRYLQGRGASLDLENMIVDEDMTAEEDMTADENMIADEDMASDQGQLHMESKILDISKQFVPSKATPNIEASHILPPISSSRVEQVRPSMQQQDRLRIPFSKRWEILKPEIERLYVDENFHLGDIIKIMKEQYNFDAM